MISNIEVNKKDNYCLISVNPKMYSLDVIYSAAYVFLDKAYVLVDGDPQEEVIIELKPKEKHDLEKLGREFNNELINYANYKNLSIKNQGIRETIIQRALLTNDPSLIKAINKVEDPKGIAIPWEEKYGKSNKKRKAKRGVKK